MIGEGVNRTEGALKVSGRIRYSAERQLSAPSLYGAIVGASVGRGRITDMRTAAAETAPGVRGNSATGRTKPATLATGHTVQVPEHLDQNTIIKIDTRTGEYLTRVAS